MYIYLEKYTKSSEYNEIDSMDWDDTAGDWAYGTFNTQDKYFGNAIYTLCAEESASGMSAGEYQWMPDFIPNSYGGIRIHAGESLTFSLPDDGSDTIYTIYAQMHYPDYGDHSYRYISVKFGDAPPAQTVGGFSDVTVENYFAEPVIWAIENGITNGTSDTTFSPDDTCTRAQIVTFLYRAMAD